MAPRPGGESDKLGNKYESAWAIRHALHCIVYPRSAITAEDIDNDLGRGSEFTFFTGDVTEVHQLKRQHGSSNYWSIPALAGLGIFKLAERHVAGGRQYHFVSLIPFGPLKELAERARSSDDLPGFTKSWLTKDLRNAFDQLSAAGVLGDAQNAWTTLRGMWFEVHDERDVIQTNSMLAELSLEGLSGHLISLAIGDVLLKNLGKRLTRTELLEQLESFGVTPHTAGARESARERVAAVTESWIGAVKRELLQPPIERDEVAQLTQTLPTDRLAIVLGTAGGGKSSVLEQAVTSLAATGAEVLALRLDRVEPFASTTELGRQLSLDTSPAAALALAADGREAYLVLDQLDAVSLASGRMPQSFDVVMDLISEALSIANIRVILACREFDVDNDHRIRALAARTDIRKVEVGLLPKEAAKAAVQRMGLDPKPLTDIQLELLRTPLHLVLLSGIADQHGALSFQSKGSLFSAFWDRKRQAIRLRRDGVRFNETLARVANAASDRQTLSVPIEVLDDGDLSDDANVLVSEHVLAREGDRIAFFHEAFFDYAFARQWISRNENLIEFLTRDEQDLFRRGQVRQILQHLYEGDHERFLLEMEAILTSSAIRFHIKEAALAVFAELQTPTTAEVDLVLRVVATGQSYEVQLWRALQRPQWFKQFYEAGYVAAWLDGTDDDLKSRAVNLMISGANVQGDDVADLLEARDAAPERSNWVRWVVRFADVHSHRRLFDLLLSAVRDGAYDDAEEELWLAVHDLANHEPSWAIELLQARLVTHGAALELDPAGKVAALTVREYGASELVRECATAEPRLFVQTFVPYLRTVMAVTEYGTEDDPPIRDRHFAFRVPDQDRHDELGDALLAATEHALQTLVRYDPEAARPTLELLAEDPHDTAQFLLYRALAAGESSFADWAGGILLQGTNRLDCGYTLDPVWVSRELVKVVARHVDDPVHRLLEDQFRDLRGPHEHGLSFGRTAFAFLSALEESRLSQGGLRRLQEYRRKFNRDAPSASGGIIGGAIGSPIPAAAMTKMTDSQWLNAMAKYDKSDHDWNTLKGGARELARQLCGQVAGDPGRFARLALRMTVDLHPAYGDAMLMGFGDASTNVDAESIFAALRHIASLSHPENDRWLGMALRPHFREAPLDLVRLILDRTLHSEDPAENRTNANRNDRGDRRAESLHSYGINTTRGSLAESLGDLLVFDPDGQRTELVRPHLDTLASDPVLSVRSCVAHTIAASLRHTRPAAYAAFEQLIDGADVLLAVHLVQELMLYIGNANPEVIDPVIQRMLSSEDGEVRQAGGRLAAFAGLEWERPELLSQTLNADALVREGTAEMCAARLERTSNASLATSALLQLINDEDDDVREAAAKVAQNLRERPLRPFAALLSSLIDSRSYEYATPQLLLALEHAPDKVDDLALKAAQRFLSVYGKEAGDIRTSAAGDAHHISELVVRGLAQSRDRTHRASLLDVLDLLLELGIYGIGDAIAASERP